ncbi:28S ribosomal protein S24-like protein [Dinothrombium tinctorium]|uniref:28S ribosomal protein S24-like protein n=1 Tax=Dinothrombium tinctorium TaxID=1965070 RepID=A0A443RKG4_9ACAR|nr:28S ribosomal protein S24-like protein [Dinothrombium tinctorium]RWS15923.1 28S ribosomal protein S24-like protein [Dinothrombium tinctorium]
MYKIGFTKTWNSWNTSNLLDGLRKSETAVEDLFIRKFISGTWHRLFASEVIIKRRANTIIIGGIVVRSILPRKMYFLIGFTEELLSYVLKCNVKMEIQTVESKEELIVKYV